MSGDDTIRIEALYKSYQQGQQAQLKLAVASTDISSAFRATASAVSDLVGEGPFHPAGRKPLSELLPDPAEVVDAAPRTTELQALLAKSPHCSVQGRSELDFEFVTHELTPGSAKVDGKRKWVIDERHRVSADLLLVNTSDRTPIVAEFKRGGDQNADYALVQALAAAAQLTPGWQRRRLRDEYPDHFGEQVPQKLDVYVIVADPPPRGARPKLRERAQKHAAELQAGGELAEWIRRIVFLEVKTSEGHLSFVVLPEGADPTPA